MKAPSIIICFFLLSCPDGGVNPGSLTGPTLVKGGPAGLLGQERDGPPTSVGIAFVPKPTSPGARPPGHVAVPRPSALSQGQAGDPRRALQGRRAP